VKALSKKRTHQFRQQPTLKPPHVSIIQRKVLLYSAALVSYSWFLSWIAYEIFLLQKPLAEVSIVNYVGVIASMAFIWAGTRFWRTVPHPAQLEQKGNIPRILEQPIQNKAKSPPRRRAKKTIANGCVSLSSRQSNKEIPDECLTCQKVIQCFSNTQPQ
jgi:hypothetical protein